MSLLFKKEHKNSNFFSIQKCFFTKLLTEKFVVHGGNIFGKKRRKNVQQKKKETFWDLLIS